MTPQEAISYIENYGWSTTRLGLGRTLALLHKLGNPQKKLKFIHVAGSNGKGSTCAMMEAILRAAGYKTGLYTSPYIQTFYERIQVNGENISGERLAKLTERVYQIAEAMEDHPSQFELVTAIAMEYFYEERCDIVVLEVGMGGALDSTNAIDAPELAVITNIGLEHTEYLGNTLEKIATTKSGIIKRGCCCVCYDGAAEVTDVIRRVCREKDVPLTCVDFEQVEGVHQDLSGQDITWCGKNYHLNLIGEHQKRNAALVLTGVEALRQRGWAIPDSAVQEGLATVKWPARLEVLHQKPTFILDGGHNPQCAQALTESLDALLPGQKVTFLVGVLADKDYDTILRMMLPYADTFICVTPHSDRALSAEKLQTYITEKLNSDAIAYNSIEEGIYRALECTEKSGCVVAFGSLYLAGGVRKAFAQEYRAWLRKEKIGRRDRLNAKERQKKSEIICKKILASSAYRRAKTVMLYKYIRGEVQLTALEEANGGLPENERKQFVYPLCAEERQMLAIAPKSIDADSPAWRKGAFGICEPDPELGEIVAPETIDLVICPCVSFDRNGHRLGMGGGYYDRFLPQCTWADIVAVAFEEQKEDALPTEPWDVAVNAIITDSPDTEMYLAETLTVTGR